MYFQFLASEGLFSLYIQVPKGRERDDLRVNLTVPQPIRDG